MEVKPFKAFRYDQEVVGDTGSCIAPPYDVIDSAQQENLYQKNQYNVVRIIKGKTASSDNEQDNQYIRAADYLRSWIENGVLKQDSTDSIYAYTQDFEIAGVYFQRPCFVALAKLEEFGKTVKPHEEILDKPILDRLSLQKATAAKFGLILCLYEDKQKIADKIIEGVTSQKPLVDFIDEQNVRHQLFSITDEENIEKVVKMMSEKSCIIADGHHRYTTGLHYRNQSGNSAANYQMMAFANTCNKGLVIFATHRLVGNLENFDFAKFLEELKADFEVIELAFDSADNKSKAKKKMLSQMKVEFDKNESAFGIYAGNDVFYIAVLKDRSLMDSIVPEKSTPWRTLDVSILHKVILEKLLGIDEQKVAYQSNLEYVKDTSKANDYLIEQVDKGEKQIAFFINPVRMEQLKMVTDCGEKMPQKTTYFFPKVYTGLTINKL